MKTTSKLPNASTAKAIADFLRKYPDFFEAYPELLADIMVPHATGQAVSLVERQVAALRVENKRLRRKHLELVGIARENEALGKRLHRLTLKLIAANGAREVLAALHEDLVRDFRAEVVAIRLFAAPMLASDQQCPEFSRTNGPEAALFQGIIAENKPVCGPLNRAQQSALFSFAEGEVMSAALIPLGMYPEWSGILALGSWDPRRYYAEMAVDFLKQLSETTSLVLNPWIAVASRCPATA
jgi:uncharacterized protein YigA (DUF484 family)